MENENLKSVDLEIVKPSDSTRIIPVKDVIELRIKVEGSAGIFIWMMSKVTTVGSGK